MDNNNQNISVNDQPVKKNIFWVPKVNDKKKIRPLIFDIYLCVKHIDINDQEVGAWSALVIKQSLENNKSQTTYMVSGEDRDNHIKMRLNALKESIEWVTLSVSEELKKHLVLNIFSNDIYLVNVIRYWITKWENTNFNIEKEERPNKELLISIMEQIRNIKIEIKWKSEETNEMLPLKRNVESMLLNFDKELETE